MSARSWPARVLLAGATCGLVFWGSTRARADHDDEPAFPFIAFDDKAIQYEEAPGNEPVARLENKLRQGTAELDYDPKFGYLPSLLKHLDITVDSQLLVFSKTSFQAPRISPAKPRALYFNDTVAIGSVQNGQVLEVVSLDPRQGQIFYTLDVRQSDRPRFHREAIACLQCHFSPATQNVPGLLVSSVYPSGDGSPFLRAGTFVTDHRTPIAERWGGWYVTGARGAAHHRGNAVAHDRRDPTNLDSNRSGNLTALDKRFDVSAYLTGTSDIVALLTLEHQTRMTNLITRIGWETRLAMRDGKTEEFRKRLDFVADEIVTYMVFADEAPIREPIEGTSTFTKTFPQRGPRDKRGRSLREFDLQQRLFRYPLSYIIYSESFDSVPPLASEAIYRKLYAVLAGKDRREKFARLSPADRQAALDILRDTKSGLPAYWNDVPTAR